jgi:hypothetical protein
MAEVYLTLVVYLILTIPLMDSQEDLAVEELNGDILVELVFPDKEIMEEVNLHQFLVHLMLDAAAEAKQLLVQVQLAAEALAALV